MPNKFDFFFQCDNCKIKLSSMVICRHPLTIPNSSSLKVANDYIKENAKKCPACKTETTWTYVTKGAF